VNKHQLKRRNTTTGRRTLDNNSMEVRLPATRVLRRHTMLERQCASIVEGANQPVAVYSPVEGMQRICMKSAILNGPIFYILPVPPSSKVHSYPSDG
jgi:hypothetical protein